MIDNTGRLRYDKTVYNDKNRRNTRQNGGSTMKKICKISKFIYFFACWWTILSINAQAYIDPSAVTYVIQAVAAVFIALGALATVFRHKIFAFFKKNTKQPEKKEIHLKEDQEEADEGNKNS